MDAVVIGTIVSMVGVLAIFVYGMIWFYNIIQSSDDEDE